MWNTTVLAQSTGSIGFEEDPEYLNHSLKGSVLRKYNAVEVNADRLIHHANNTVSEASLYLAAEWKLSTTFLNERLVL